MEAFWGDCYLCHPFLEPSCFWVVLCMISFRPRQRSRHKSCAVCLWTYLLPVVLVAWTLDHCRSVDFRDFCGIHCQSALLSLGVKQWCRRWPWVEELVFCPSGFSLFARHGKVSLTSLIILKDSVQFCDILNNHWHRNIEAWQNVERENYKMMITDLSIRGSIMLWGWFGSVKTIIRAFDL